MSVIPIRIEGDRAVLEVNPNSELVTYLDRWASSGFLASLGVLNGNYTLKQVTYDLTKVDFAKIKKVADNLAKQKFSCPVCQKLSEERARNAAEDTKKERVEEMQAPVKSHEAQEAVKEIIAKEKPEVAILDELEQDEERQQMRERAIKNLIEQLDSALLIRALRGF